MNLQAFLIGLASFGIGAHAFAQGNAPGGPAPAQPLPSPAMQPVPAVAVAPAAQAPGGPVATPPAVVPGVQITPNCSMAESHGFDEAEVRTAAEIMCQEVANKHLAGKFEVRFGRLAGRSLLTLVRVEPTHDERRVFISGLDETPTAATRLAASMKENKPLGETAQVDSVLDSESGPTKAKRGRASVGAGIFGATALGRTTSPSGGFQLWAQYETPRFAILGEARAGGISSADSSLSNAQLDIGARYFTSEDDFAPFLGGGLGFAYFNVRDTMPSQSMDSRYPTTYLSSKKLSLDGSGFDAHLEVGAAFLRTHRTQLLVNLRADIPMFALQDVRSVYTAGAVAGQPGAYSTLTERQYVVPVTLNLGMTFR